MHYKILAIVCQLVLQFLIPIRTHRHAIFHYNCPMEFSDWLRHELKQRDMDQTELSRRAEMMGYPIARNSVSRILSGERDAGPDACIAIAYGLGVSREEVFRARGWLLKEPEVLIQPDADPRLVKIVRGLTSLEGVLYERAITGVDALVTSYIEVAQDGKQ